MPCTRRVQLPLSQEAVALSQTIKIPNVMKRRITLRNLYVLATALLLVGCTKDELPNVQGDSLPEGKYPITFTVAASEQTQAAPMVRVADPNDGGVQRSRWTAGDVIAVSVSSDGRTMQTHCTLDGEGHITRYDPQLYWSSTGMATVNAWYSNLSGQATIASGAVNLADQRNGLAYVLKARTTTANYQSGNIQLDFEHQLAKVRVKLTKASYEGALANPIVSIKGYTTCTINQGNITNPGGEGYIPMRRVSYGGETYYEACLVPGIRLQSEALSLTADGKTTKVNLAGAIALGAGRVYTLNVAVEKPLYVKLADITESSYTFTRDGILEGDANTYNKTIYVNDGVTLTLRNVKIQTTDAAATPAISCHGNATIVLERDSYLKGGSRAPGLRATGKLTIKGEGKLEAVGGSNEPAIGGGIYSGRCGDILIESGRIIARSTEESTAGLGHFCGNITITGGYVEAKGGNFATGIGSGKFPRCGNISITGGTVIATSGLYAPAIGSGKFSACGTISITGGTVTATAVFNSTVIGAGSFGRCGTITIDRTKANVTEINL